MSGSTDMDMSTTMPMSMMTMTFFSSTVTPLFSTAWTPNSAGQYAGTCIFLIAFAAIFRALIAIRFNYDRFAARMALRRGDNQAHLYNDEYKGAHRPWRANEAVALGFMDMVIAGISYLL
jgi:copper transporter 1